VTKQLFLVSLDCGMSSMWWRIRARSAREIQETFAEVQVRTDPTVVASTADWKLDVVDIDAVTVPKALVDLRAARVTQRDQPGFGRLIGRDVVYLRQSDDEADDTLPETYLMELDANGYRLRQVEIHRDGVSIRRTPDDWAFDSPEDLYDPALPEHEISRAEFERAWEKARPATD